MLRATVYISQQGVDRDLVSRHVLELQVETVADFQEKARRIALADIQLGYDVSFGPIGPPWTR